MKTKGILLLIPLITGLISCDNDSHIVKYKVIFDLNYETEERTKEIEVLSGQKVLRINDPVRQDYNFDNWYQEGSNLPYNFNLQIYKDLTLYAKWDEETLQQKYGAFSLLNEWGEIIQGQENVYQLSQPGIYYATGYLDGQLIFDSIMTDGVELRLSNCYITNKKTPIIWNCEDYKIEIKAGEGTTNYLLSTEITQEMPAILSENNVEIGGSGNLYLSSTSSHGIDGSNVTIKGNANIEIAAVKDGIHAKAFFQTGSVLTIRPGTDGVETNLNKNNEKGNIEISNGTFISIGGNIGLKAETSILITEQEGNETIIHISDFAEDKFEYGTTLRIDETVEVI